MASTSVVVYTCPVRKAVLSQQAPLGGLAIKLLKSVLQAGEKTTATQTASAQSSALKTGIIDEWHKFSMLIGKKGKVWSKELHIQRCRSGDKWISGTCLACVLCFHLQAEHITENLLSWAASGFKNVGSVKLCLVKAHQKARCG